MNQKVKIALMSFALCCTMLMAGCAKENVEAIADHADEYGPNMPTTDQRMVTSSAPAVVLGGTNSQFGEMIAHRFVNGNGDLDGMGTRVVVGDYGVMRQLPNDKWMELVRLYNNHGNIIIIDATLADCAAFASKAYEVMVNMGETPDGFWQNLQWLDYFSQLRNSNPESSNTPFEAVVINSQGFYMVDRQSQESTSVDYSCERVSKETGGVDSSATHSCDLADISAYHLGLMADKLVQWVDKSLVSVDAADGKVLKKEVVHLVPIAFDPRTFTSLQPKGWGTITVPCQIIYTLTPVHDMNEHKDHYVVHRNVEFDGSHLGCGPTKGPEWWWVAKNKKDWYYGPYLSHIQIESHFNGPTPDLRNWQPQNRMTSTTYTNSFSWSLTSALTISEKPGINLGGGITVNEAVATTLPDLGMTVWHNNPYPKYLYWISKRPIGHGLTGKHDIVAANLREDISNQQTLTWIVRPTDNAAYSFTTDFEVQVEFLRSYRPFIRMYDYYDQFTVRHHGLYVPLPAPARTIQEWRMYCETSDPYLIHFIASKYEDYFYDKVFQMPAATDADRKNIDAFIDKFIGILSNDRSMWRSSGFTGDYTFVWRPARSSRNYRTYVFHVGTGK